MLLKNVISKSGFTLIELMVTVGIFIFMTALVVANYGSFNDGTLLTSMAYDVALTLRDAQSYGLNVQGYTPSSAPQNFNYPYGIHFSSTSGSNNQMILFADSYPSTPNGICDNGSSGVCLSTQTTAGDNIITTYTLTNGGMIKSVCAGTGPGASCASPSSGIVDITFKRPDPNAIIVAPGSSSCPTNTSPCAYAEIQVENAAKTSTRTIVVRGTGEIAVQNK
jgi:type II secretory pathway pseudopilin PulG